MAGPIELRGESLLICGDAATTLEMIPDESVQTVVTSPPYWSLRDYGVDAQTGRDDDLGDYVGKVVEVFEQVRRVLRGDGTVWLNVGDSYTSGNRRYRAPDRKNRSRAMAVRPPTPQGLKPKDLIGVPWRLALALQDAGWWIRAEVIWHKPNAHPESVRDRPVRAHETVFLLSKNQNYHYRVDAVRGSEPAEAEDSLERQHRASQAGRRRRGRPSRRHADDTGEAVPRDHQHPGRIRSGSVRRIGHVSRRGPRPRSEVDWHRSQSDLRGSDRALSELSASMTLAQLKSKLDEMTPLKVEFVARVVARVYGNGPTAPLGLGHCGLDLAGVVDNGIIAEHEVVSRECRS